jgi:hypothetical protein
MKGKMGRPGQLKKKKRENEDVSKLLFSHALRGAVKVRYEG